MSRVNLVGLLPSELEDLAVQLGASRYRGRQLATWLYRKSVVDLEAMTDIVAEQLGVDKEKITPETSFVNDLGADSLDTVELVMELEEEFDINIPDDAAEKIQTVGQAVEYIESSMNGKS